MEPENGMQRAPVQEQSDMPPADNSRTEDADAATAAKPSRQPLSTTDIASGGNPGDDAEPAARMSLKRPEDAAAPADAVPLLAADATTEYQSRWQAIQAAFVDKPRDAVEQADALVAELMQQLATSFAEERTKLESAWEQGHDVDTEDLRIGLTRYRSFFQRLLSV